MELEQHTDGAVRILRINRPEARNALTMDLLAAIGTALAEADTDPEVAAIVLGATGDRAFCAGMDLRGFAEGDRSLPDAEGVAAFLSFLRNGIVTPTIGAANATAVAGGFELLLACDLVVASTEARFGLPEVRRALLPAGGGLFLSQRIPLAVALELTLTGDDIGAGRAFELGLVNRLVPPGDVLDEALGLARRIAGNGPLAVRAIKRLVRAAAGQPAADVWALQDQLQTAVFESNDAREGARAFVEKRDPVWTGS